MSSVSSARSAPMSARAVQLLTRNAFVGGVAGLEIVVSAGGTRSWRLYYRIAGGDGRRRAMPLGRFPEVSLADARRRGAAALALAADGEDPKIARTEKVAALNESVADAVSAYLKSCESSNDPKTLSDKRNALAAHILPPFADRPIRRLNRVELLDVLDGLSSKPAMRRNLHAYLRHFLRWAVERSLLSEDPLAGVRAPKPTAPRERVLSDTEIIGLWSASGVMADIARLLLLTAQRKSSVEAMRRDQISSDRHEWLVPGDSMKSSKPHAVPLTQRALEILTQQPVLNGPYFFGVGSCGSKPYGGASNGMQGLRRQLGDPDWTLHDLRRTAVTLAQRGGAGIEEIQALTQHKTAGVIGVYARHAYAAEKRCVVELIDGEIQRLLSQ